mmetsp:Transcript_19479/g.40939  ORF Transcript_19479/g.40939 Transcript_19479/m.40939 type:complete len:145 (+) Transcript_19479:112-546(+)
MLLQESPSENNREDTNPEEEEEDDDSDSQLFRGIQPQGEADDDDDDEQKLMLDELAWRTHKVLLEEQNEKRFQKALRSKPLKLSYRQAKKWVQANLGAETQEEFEDLVLNGNLRTPYVPKDPKRYYTDVGTWLGWEDFLLGKPT